MKRDKKTKDKLLVSVHTVRSLDATGLKKVSGGACPTSKPVAPTG